MEQALTLEPWPTLNPLMSLNNSAEALSFAFHLLQHSHQRGDASQEPSAGGEASGRSEGCRLHAADFNASALQGAGLCSAPCLVLAMPGNATCL